MGVSIQFHTNKKGHQTARLHIYNPQTKKRGKAEPVKNWILYSDDSNKKSKLAYLEQLRRDRETELYRNEDKAKVYHEDFEVKPILEGLCKRIRTKSAKSYHYAALQLYAFYGANSTFKEIDSVNFTNFANSLYNQMKINSANVYIVNCLKLLKDAHELGYLKKVPSIKKRSKIKSNSKEILLIDEFRDFLAVSYVVTESYDLKPAMTLAFYTGIGYTDCKAFRKSEDITGEYFKYSRAKTESPVKIKLHPEVIEMLPEKLKLRASQTVNGHIRELKWRAGIQKHITFYSMRHSFAVNSRLAGVPTELLSRYLGHSNLDQTVDYLSSFIELTAGADQVYLPKL